MTITWILIGLVANTVIAQGFPDKEACWGRAKTLEEQKISAKCVSAPNAGSGFITDGSNHMRLCDNVYGYDQYGNPVCK